jgi:hypothetical protein
MKKNGGGPAGNGGQKREKSKRSFSNYCLFHRSMVMKGLLGLIDRGLIDEENGGDIIENGGRRREKSRRKFFVLEKEMRLGVLWEKNGRR